MMRAPVRQRSRSTAGSGADYGIGGPFLDNLTPTKKRPQPADPGDVVELRPERTSSSHIARSKTRRQRERRLNIAEKFLREVRNDPLHALLSVLLLVLVLTVGGGCVNRNGSTASLKRAIAAHEHALKTTREDIEIYTRMLAEKTDEAFVREEAINKRGMLRVDSAHRGEVHIQTMGLNVQQAQQTSGNERVEALDVMLGLLDLMGIGG